MTATETTDPDTTSNDTSEPDSGGVLVTIALDLIDPHPDNPRKNPGDLTELTRSIKAHGVLQHPTVMATNNGRYLAVAGHRRVAAARNAEHTDVTVVVRSFTEAEAVEVMMVENIERSDLTIREEIEGIARLMALDTGYNARRLCTRLGKSQRWAKDRLAVAVLPASVLDLIDTGDVTLSGAVAIAGLADLGPDAFTMAVECVTERHATGERAAQITRQTIERDAGRKALTDKLEKAGVRYEIGHDAFPGAVDLRTLGLDPEQAKAHVKEPCHAVRIVDRWDGPAMIPVCTDPKRHKAKGDKPAASPIVTTAKTHGQRSADDSKQRRAGRVARMAVGVELFARTRGGPKRETLIDLGLWAVVEGTYGDTAKRARALLGLPDDANLTEAAEPTPKDLQRVAAACACAKAEEMAYHRKDGMTGRWFNLLIDHGWEPDEWTTTRLG